SNEVINTFEGVADYIVKYGRLPDNFITKAEAS
nr:Bpo II=12.608 kda ribonuclease isoform II {N-terminal} [Bacillus polymyxa, 514, Peptide Partial, 32 aa] [Paenibacillus polymyxa]